LGQLVPRTSAKSFLPNPKNFDLGHVSQNARKEVCMYESPEVFELGKLLGRRQAFSLVAGRCSAADAEILRSLREDRSYLSMEPTWDEFCPKHLGMSKRTADRTIHLLEEFGPSFFELSNLVRISPEVYRSIEPAVRDQAIHCNGEAIALISENADKIGVAVAELRRAALEHAKTAGFTPERLYELEQQRDEVVAGISALWEAAPDSPERDRVQSIVSETMRKLKRLEVSMAA
jgi:hypothetical protein